MSDKSRELPLVRLAWRNTYRNKRRTLLTVSAIVVAVAAMIFGQSYVSGVVANALDTYARTEAGHVRIRQEDYSARERAMPLHLNVGNLSEVLPALRAHAHVTEALPRIRTAVLIDGADSNRPGVLFGMDLAREEGYMNPTAMLVEGRLPRAGTAEVMIGTGFAEENSLAVGDTLTMLGQTAYRSLGGMQAEIVGLASTGVGHLDNRIIVSPIDQVQIMADMPDAATDVLVFADDPAGADSLAASLARDIAPLVPGGIEVRPWMEQGSIMSLLSMVRPMWTLILLILLLMASLIIVNTMLMTVMERTQEFGMLAALGMRRGDLVTLIVVEGVCIGLIGALIGGLIGTGFSLWLQQVGIDMTQATRSMELPFQGKVYADWTFLQTLGSALLGMVAAGLAAVYPAVRAVRLAPAEALRP